MSTAAQESLPRRTMRMLGELVPLDGAVFYRVDARGASVGLELLRLDEARVGDYVERFHRLDPCHPRHFQRSGETLVRLHEILEPRSFVRSEYYRDFFRRIGVRHEVELFFRDRGRIVAGMSLLRSPKRGDFSDRETEAVARIRPFVELAIAAHLRPRSLADEFALTEREVEVVRHVVAGARNEEIARALFVSLATVKTHLQHVFEKMGVRSRTELAARVHALG